MMQTTILAALCALLLSASACQAAPHGDSHRRRLPDDHLDKSIVRFNDAIDKNPRQIEALLQRAKAYALTNRFEQAIRDCDAVLRMDPKNAEAYFQKGLFLGFRGGSGSVIFAIADARADLEKAAKFSTDASRRAEISEIFNHYQGGQGASDEIQTSIAAAPQATATVRVMHQSAVRIQPAAAIPQRTAR